MESHQCKPSNNETHVNNGMQTIPSKPRNNNWQVALNSVYFLITVRVAVRSRAYTIVEIGSDSDSDSDSTSSATHVGSAQPTSLSFNKEQTLISLRNPPTQVGTAQETSLSFNEEKSLISITKEKHSYCVGNHIYFTLAATFLGFILEAVKSIPTVIQIILGILSLAIGIKFHGPSTGWYDGGNIFISVFFTIFISAAINFKHNQVLNHPINERDVNDSNKPLRAQFKKLTSNIMKLGIFVASLLLIVLSIHYFGRHGSQKVGIMEAIMNILSEVINIVVIAKFEGLQLATTLIVCYFTEKMLKHDILIRRLSVWKNLGSITVICTDKTGTLDYDQIGVSEFWVGKDKVGTRPSNLAPIVAQLIQEGVGLNNTRSTSTVDQTTSELTPKVFDEYPIEKAIFEWGVNDLKVRMDEMSQSFEDLKVEAFDSKAKLNGVMARRKMDNTIQVHFKGAADVILPMCSYYYDQKGLHKAILDEDKQYFRTIIQDMEAKGLTCIAFAQKQEKGDAGDNNVMHLGEKENSSLSLLGIIGLAVPCETSVREAVETFRNAGVGVKLITEDNKAAATEIGLECGILNLNNHHELHEDAVIEGTRFRSYSDQERLEKVDHIRVMASSSVQDKLLLVQCLKKKQHVVAITGANSDDAPALQEANVSIVLGVESTGDVKKSSDIVILGGKYFATIVTIIKWGRCSCANIQKVIQVQLTVVVVGSIVSFISAISSGNIPPLWTNILLDTLLSLALATKQPTEDDELMKLLEEPIRIQDDHRTIISKAVWRSIIGQTTYQVAILLILQFKGHSIFGIGENVQDTLIFNCFLLCQVFNLFNARKFEKKNIFEGITLESKSFWLILGITVIVQFFMVEFFCKFASTERLTWGQWAACVGIAAFTWPIGWFIKCTAVQFPFRMETILLPLQTDFPITNPCVSQKDFKWGKQFKTTGRIFTFLRPFVLRPLFPFAP